MITLILPLMEIKKRENTAAKSVVKERGSIARITTLKLRVRPGTG